MANPDHHSHSGKQHEHDHGHEHSNRRPPLHHDWRLWVAVILMLIAMAAYVLSDNEVFDPGGKKEPVPAAPAL